LRATGTATGVRQKYGVKLAVALRRLEAQAPSLRIPLAFANTCGLQNVNAVSSCIFEHQSIEHAAIDKKSFSMGIPPDLRIRFPFPLDAFDAPKAGGLDSRSRPD
jgi:hypothetical protein